ncbi:MAG: hypothetical protein V7706_12010 [Dietzia psychralcaliphila]
MSSIVGATITIILLSASGAPAFAIGGAVAIAVANNMSGVRAAWMQRAGQLALNFNAQRMAPQVAGLIALGALVLSPERSANVWIVCVGVFQFAAVVITGSLLGASPSWRIPSMALQRRSIHLVPISWLSHLQYRVDLIAVTFFFPPSQVAFYSVAVAIQSAVVAVGQSTGMRWFSKHGDASAVLAAKQTTKISMAGAILAMAFSWPAIWIAYGIDFMPAAPVALILCIGAVPASVDYLVTHVAIARGTHALVVPVKLGIVVAVVILVAGISALGWPIAAAALAAMLVTMIGVMIQLRVVSNAHT